MTESLKERITRVARIAQRTARNHEDQQEAQALIDEMAATQLDAVSVAAANAPNRASTDAEREAFAAIVAEPAGTSPPAPSAVPGRNVVAENIGAPVEVATADTAPATKPVDKQKGAKK
jgi:hypothetical protein